MIITRFLLSLFIFASFIAILYAIANYLYFAILLTTMELKELNEKYIQLEKKRAALKLQLYEATKELDDLVDSAVKEEYNLDIDTGKWVKEGT